MGAAIGSLPCRGLDCSKEVPVTETAGGSLSLKCGFCGFSAYAQPGSKAARAIRAAMHTEEGAAAAAPASKPAPATAAAEPAAPAPAPTHRPANSVFSLGGIR